MALTEGSLAAVCTFLKRPTDSTIFETSNSLLNEQATAIESLFSFSLEGCCKEGLNNSVDIAIAEKDSFDMKRLPPGMLSPAMCTPLRSLRPDRRF